MRARLAEPRAKACFERAVAIAQEQGARWWELRARTSLVDWQRAHRKPIDAVNFAAFVAGFTEGEATADLRAARRLAHEIHRTARP